MAGRWISFVSALLLCAPVACESAASGAGKSAPARPGAQTRPTRPKSPARADASDTVKAAPSPGPWAAAAVEAVDKDTLPAFAAGIEPDLTSALADLSRADLATVTQLATYREFGRFFGKLTY